MNAPLTDRSRPDFHLLRGLSDSARLALEADCSLQSFSVPTEVLQQGEPADGCYMVLQGRIEISHIDSHGNPMVLNMASPGEVAGEVEIFCDKPCVATCTALPGTVALYCTAETLWRHMPPALLMRNFAEILHGRLALDVKFRLIGQFSSPDQRICHYILQFTAPEAPETRLSQIYLASLAGCSRQTVNRRLGVLRREGVIDVKRGTIRVLDRARLLTEAGD